MEKRIKEGEKLLLLIRRSKRQVKDVAEDLEIKPTSLSRMFKSESLTLKIKKRASALFGVPDGYFEPGDQADEVNEETPAYVRTYTSEEVKRLTKELEEAKREALELKARVYDLLREKGKL